MLILMCGNKLSSIINMLNEQSPANICTILAHFTNLMRSHDILIFSVTYYVVGLRVEISFEHCYVLLIIIMQ